jgi:hypothetical protein
MLNKESPIGETMTSVIQNSPHTNSKHPVNGLRNSVNAQENPGTGQGIDAFMLEIEQAIQARQPGQDLTSQNQDTLALSAKNILAVALQNLPDSGANLNNPAKIADQMQLLSAALVAQGLLTQPIPGLNPLKVANLTGNTVQNPAVDGVQNIMTSTGIAQALLNQNNLGSASTLALLKAQANSNGLASPSTQNTQTPQSAAILPSGLGSTNDQAIKVLALETPGVANSPIASQTAVLMGAGPTFGDFSQKQTPKGAHLISSALNSGLISESLNGARGAKALSIQAQQQIQSSTAVVDKTPTAPPDTTNSSADKNLANIQAEKTAAADEVSGALAGSTNLGNLQPHLAANAPKIQVPANEASLASGPMHSQIMSAARSGGGRIAIELTPPGQGTLRIDLRIDQTGQAHLIVEGASDATKARLDHGGQQLKNDFAQMGLSLSLDLRQGGGFSQTQNQSSNSQQFSGFSSNNAPQVDDTPVNSLVSSSKPSNNVDNSTVHLFA